ncbi:hypothetical protein HN371_22405 [Candidatus Poribacteria bacterium]|jgi:hypothetical protein|nr:hypothetical protein [Candidatus Poribacteria bacterium]
MIYKGHAYVRLSANVARAFGMSYRTMWNCVKSGDSGLNVLRVDTRQPGKRLIYLRLADINRALGYPLYDPPTLADTQPHGAENAKETDDADHQEAH